MFKRRGKKGVGEDALVKELRQTSLETIDEKSVRLGDEAQLELVKQALTQHLVKHVDEPKAYKYRIEGIKLYDEKTNALLAKDINLFVELRGLAQTRRDVQVTPVSGYENASEAEKIAATKLRAYTMDVSPDTRRYVVENLAHLKQTYSFTQSDARCNFNNKQVTVWGMDRRLFFGYNTFFQSMETRLRLCNVQDVIRIFANRLLVEEQAKTQGLNAPTTIQTSTVQIEGYPVSKDREVAEQLNVRIRFDGDWWQNMLDVNSGRKVDNLNFTMSYALMTENFARKMDTKKRTQVKQTATFLFDFFVFALLFPLLRDKFQNLDGYKSIEKILNNRIFRKLVLLQWNELTQKWNDYYSDYIQKNQHSGQSLQMFAMYDRVVDAPSGSTSSSQTTVIHAIGESTRYGNLPVPGYFYGDVPRSPKAYVKRGYKQAKPPSVRRMQANFVRQKLRALADPQDDALVEFAADLPQFSSMRV